MGRKRERIEPTFGKGKRAPARGRKPAGRQRDREAPRGPSLLGRLFRLALVAGIWATILVGGAIVFMVSRLPDPILATLQDRPPNLTILAADGTVLAERGLKRGHVHVDQLPPYLIQAVLATEDQRFYRHFGVDPLGLVRAALANAAAGGVVEGGSTITQQLAKNLFLSADRTMERKLKEVVYALWLEQRFSKDEILELYLNRVYLGGGAFGVEAASWRYFGKSARHVTLPEAAILAGLLKAPSRYSPTANSLLAHARAETVLDRMVDARAISQMDAAAAAANPAEARATESTGYEYAVDWVAEELPLLVGDANGDLVVETTIDASLQRVAQAAIARGLEQEGAKLKASEASAIVLDRSGGVRAVIGGRSYKSSPYNRAVKAMRQPGSAFKPFVYLAALESGYAPDSIAHDEPIRIKGWAPKNYDGEYRGAISVRDSFARSINTVAVRLAHDAGVWRVVRTARRLGVTAPLHDNLSIALGTAEVTLAELTGAFLPFANEGYAEQPHLIRRVLSAEGAPLYERSPPQPAQAVALPYVAAMNQLMGAVVQNGTGRSARIDGHAAGGKTGTSQDFRDAWFVGYTGRYVAGVWVGNDDNSPMRKATGGGLPAKLWREIMTEAHHGEPPAHLPGLTRPAEEPLIASPDMEHAPVEAAAPERPALLRRLFGALGGEG
jgi:penicillin-binding protein 1A